MNFDVKFDNCPLHFSAKFTEDDSSFEGFGQDLQLIHGKDGKSAYEVAVANGFEGTEAEWLESLHGEDGIDGKDGAPGRDGQDGQPGRDGIDGKDYILTEADKQEIAEQAAELVDVPEGGGGGGVTAEEVDEKIAEAIEAIPNPSWNDLTDKPFGEGETPWILVASAISNASHANINFSAVEGRNYKLDVEDRIYNTVEASNIAPCTTSQMMGLKYYRIGSSVDVVHGDGGAANTVWNISTGKQVASGFYRFKIYEESDTVKTLDEKYIPDSIARVADLPAVPTKLSELENDSGFLTADDIPEGGGSVSWNDITDKPFGEVPVFDIEWDGNMDGHFALDMSALGYEEGLYYVKVIDIVPIEEDLVGSIGHRITLDGYHSDFQVTPDIIDTASFPGAYNIGGRIVVVHNQDLLNSAIGAPDGYVTNGTYFLLREGKDYVSRFTSGAKITKLDEKSIPTTVPVIQTAQIGQTIVVKAVDENGKPTEWEAADLPTGGGGSSVQSDWNQNDESQPDYVKNRPFYDIPPAFDIRWDGNMDGHFALDLSALGYDSGSYFVKVSDFVTDDSSELVGATITSSTNLTDNVLPNDIDVSTFPGSISLYGYVVVVVNQSALNAALGLPDGYVTNGTYFYADSEWHVAQFVGPQTTKKIDDRYLNLSTVAKTGEYEDLAGKPDVSDVVKYTKQLLDDSQKAMVRSNINAAAKDVALSLLIGVVPDYAFRTTEPAPCDSRSDATTSLKTSTIMFVGKGAFMGARWIKEIDLPNVTWVGGSAFEGCTRIEKADLHQVANIDARAFLGCTNLKSVILRRTDAVVYVFDMTKTFYDEDIYFYVPASMVEQYKADKKWGVYYRSKIRAIEDYPEICG